MNFVKLYIGDYLRDTGTLTVAEHGAYVLMLLHYYAAETGLPQGKELHRLLRAETKAEREAVETVCAKFWHANADGKLSNKRADSEILKAEHQREVNRSVGKLGGRPKRTETDSLTDSVTESVSGSQPNRNPNHSQTPEPKDLGRATVVADPPDLRAQLEAEGFTPTPAGAMCKAMREAGFHSTNPGDPRLLALIEQGATRDEFVGVAAEAATKGKGWAWLLVALENRRAEAAAIVLAPKPEAPPDTRIAETARLLAEQRARPTTKPPQAVRDLLKSKGVAA